MSATQPPRTQGPQLTVNPVELFWDQHRRKVIFASVVVILMIAAGYALDYQKRSARDTLWGTVAEATKLADGYQTDGTMAMFVRDPQWAQYNVGMSHYLQSAQTELVTGLPEDLQKATGAELNAALEQARGTDAEPLILWAMANRAYLEKEWDLARERATDLQTRFPKHFLCAVTAYPPQFRPPVEGQEEEAPSARKKPPKLEEPLGNTSAVALLIAQIDAEKAFRAEHPLLFQAPEPAPSPTAVVTTSEGVFKIRFYPDRAPKTVANFVEKAKSGFYDGQHIDEIVRTGSAPGAAKAAAEFHFGFEGSKQDDREQWKKPVEASAMEFEESGLSHFPLMVAAAPEADGKASQTEIWINVEDAASRHDELRVVFGRVVEGVEVAEKIAAATYATEDENRAGRGRPRDNIKIESIRIEE